MKNLYFKFPVQQLQAQVEAECEGECRYMVRMSLPGKATNVRIGYLSGKGKAWVLEPLNTQNRNVITGNSARRVCQRLLVRIASFTNKR